MASKAGSYPARTRSTRRSSLCVVRIGLRASRAGARSAWGVMRYVSAATAFGRKRFGKRSTPVQTQTHAGVFPRTTLARVQLLFPDRRETSPDELASGLRLGERAPAGRPYLALNMISTLDGKATIDWRTRGLSSDLDRALFHQLRTQADAVMVGAGTARTERYGELTKTDELQEKRLREGVAPEALAVIVSARLDLPA